MKLILAFILMFAFSVRAASIATSAKKAVEEVQNQKAVFLDVREPSEYSSGEVKDALAFPTSKMKTKEWSAFVANLPKDKPIYTYCAAGGRASNVAKELSKRGFKAHSVGGFGDVKAAGAVLK